MNATTDLATYAPPPYPIGADPAVFYSCTRKLYWGCETLADNWATLLSFTFPGDERPFTSYACKYCDGWHVGHTPKDAT